MPTGDPPIWNPACTCGPFWSIVPPGPCPVHTIDRAACAGNWWNDPNIKIVQTTIGGGTFKFVSSLAPTIEVDGDNETGRVYVTIDGIRFTTTCENKEQAIALAIRTAVALGIKYEPEG